MKTDKAEEKLLDDDQYIPPPGHLAFVKGHKSHGEENFAQIVSIGGSRMDEVRTWGHASELFTRSLEWSEQSFEVGDLDRLNSFQVTTTKKRTSKGSVTLPLHGATFVDFEPESSNIFHILVAHGQNLETFTTNDSIMIMKGDANLENVTVTKWLPDVFQYREFDIPEGWSDGSEFLQRGKVPSSRTGSKLGILKEPCREDSNFVLLSTGGVFNPVPGKKKYLPLDSNVFLLKYPEMRWIELENQELLSRSHHSMHIAGSTAYIIGGYSWENNKMTKLFPVNQVTRIVFNDDCQLEFIDIVELKVDASITFSPFVTGFSFVYHSDQIILFGAGFSLIL